MAARTLIKNATLVSDGKEFASDLLIVGDRIEKIASSISADDGTQVVDAAGLHLLPGMIDDQVHFREPGLTAKGDLASESAASVAGGTTSFMDMPNVNPATVTREVMRAKYALASGRCHANYAFYFGATNDNIDEIRALRPDEACGIKAFMGASTLLFADAPLLVVTHCEDSPMIWANEKAARERYGDDVPIGEHPNIRSAEACLKSSTLATGLARKHDARLHVLHLTTAMEMPLFDTGHRSTKRITAEVCIHHLWFDAGDYAQLGNRIKCNPAIKTAEDRAALRQALMDGRLDIIATDHAPHLLSEKRRHYFAAPAGLPLTQHALVAALDLTRQMPASVPFIVDRVSHASADIFGIVDRGYLREGYFADLALVDLQADWTADDDSVLYKCGWTPFTGTRFHSRVMSTWVNGQLAWDGSRVLPVAAGQPLVCDSSR